MNELIALDHKLFSLINNDWTLPVLDAVMPFLTAFKNTLPLLLVIAVFLLLKYRFYGAKAVIACLLSVGIGDVVAAQMIKPYVDRARPQFTQVDSRLLVSPAGSPSFPSNHATNTFAAAMSLSLFFPSLAAYAFTIAAIVSYSRVYVGVHFPLDVIAGAILGSLIACLIYKIFNSQRSRLPRWRP